MPWTDLWSEDFHSDPRSYKKLEHCMINIIAKAGNILQRIEMADHYGEDYKLAFDRAADGRDLAVIVMSALKAANVYPDSTIELEDLIKADLIRRKVDIKDL